MTTLYTAKQINHECFAQDARVVGGCRQIIRTSAVDRAGEIACGLCIDPSRAQLRFGFANAGEAGLNCQVISAASDDHLNSNSTQSPAQVKLYFPFFAETQEEEVLLDNHLKPIIYTVFYFSQCPRVKSHFAQTTQ